MARKADYLNKGDAVFQDFFRNMTQYIAVKTSGTKPEWTHIDPVRQSELMAAYEAWYNAHSLCLQPHSNADTKIKNEKKAAAKKVIRAFVQQYLMFPPVNDADRINMLLPLRDPIHTVLPRPDKAPFFTMSPKNNRMVSIDFRAEKGGRRAKPYGYTGVVICFALLDHYPANYDELSGHVFASKTPITLEFNENDRGKRLYVALYWQNSKGEQGPWSDIQMTFVP